MKKNKMVLIVVATLVLLLLAECTFLNNNSAKAIENTSQEIVTTPLPSQIATALTTPTPVIIPPILIKVQVPPKPPTQLSAGEKWRILEGKKVWTQADLAWAIETEAIRQGIPAAQRKWLVRAAIDIVFLGRCESHGNTKAGATKRKQYLGLFQFGRSWGSRTNRLSGTWNVMRFVKVYRLQGQRGVRRHWKATLNR